MGVIVSSALAKLNDMVCANRAGQFFNMSNFL